MVIGNNIKRCIMYIMNTKNTDTQAQIKDKIKELLAYLISNQSYFTQENQTQIPEILVNKLSSLVNDYYPVGLDMPFISEVGVGSIGLDWYVGEKINISLDIKPSSYKDDIFKTMHLYIDDSRDDMENSKMKIDINHRDGWNDIRDIFVEKASNIDLASDSFDS